MSDLLRDFDEFLSTVYSQIESDMEQAGESAVAFNVQSGDYQDRTGRLRRSNYYRVEKNGPVPTALVIGNSAPYAEYVEARRYMVVTGGFLLAVDMLT